MKITLIAELSLFLIYVRIIRIAAKLDNELEDDNSDIECENGTKLTPYVCLSEKYSADVSPRLDNEHKVRINSSLVTRSIREVNVLERYMTVDIFLYIYWPDNRIRKKFTKDGVQGGVVPLPISKIESIWTPDLYIFDLKDFQTYKVVKSVNSISILYKCYWNPKSCHENYTTNNTILQYVLEARVQVYCLGFNFDHFPFEHNTCTFLLGTALFPANFIWGNDSNVSDDWKYTYALDKAMSGYIVTNISWINDHPSNVNEEWYGMGKAIGFKIFLKRKIGHYVISYYIPCACIVMLTQISFIVPLTSIPGRVALLVTEFLTLINIFLYQQSSNPGSGEMTALGLYLMVSMFIIVAALVEFAVVLVMKHFPTVTDIRSVPPKSVSVVHSLDAKEQLNLETKIQAADIIKKAWVIKKASLQKLNYQKIDRICSVLFPSLFLLFNLIYFSYYNIA